MSLSTKCMIVDMSMGVWEARKLDRAASEKTNTDAKAKPGTARVIKRIVPDEAFKDIVTAKNALKAHLKAHTLPWKDKGERILMRNMYDRFMSEYGTLERAFNDAADNFSDRIYPPARERAAFNMGDLFNPEDFPHPEDVRRKFYVSLAIDPVPEAGDFRVQLDEAHVSVIKQQMEDRLQERMAIAMKDVWTRLVDVVHHYVEKMGDSEATFRDSTVNNLTTLIDTLPGLNIMGDPQLKAIRKRLQDTLYSVDPETLRSDKDTRAQAAADAQAILDEMRGLVSGL